jgi:uncharacterized protein YyaL (SSP411 family)
MNAHEDGNAFIARLLAVDRERLAPDGRPDYNRLIFSASPYLLQHADNPVDWYPWGEGAFARARSEDKPVFLSIGYATCHWCHVMARESFADPAVAGILNRHCIAIKVDREERPDVDDCYMTAAQLLAGSGGWPLNLFLTPDRLPFFAATYIPPVPRHGMMAFPELVEKIAGLWAQDRSRVERNCAQVLDGLLQFCEPALLENPEPGIADAAYRQLVELYDPVQGGFGGAPKFPMPAYHAFLLWYGKQRGNRSAADMVRESLRAMRGGGIFDQLGGGMHRYSVDREWLVPHFEKMLYDQALLAGIALDAHRATGDPFCLDLAGEIIGYVLRDLAAPEGGFCAAEDADSEGAEGTFYLWRRGEIIDLLGEAEGSRCCSLFGVTEEGNFEGRNILHLSVSLPDWAEQEGLTIEEVKGLASGWRERLLAARGSRIRPLRDGKVVTAWNGLMVASLAKGYGITGNKAWLDAGRQAVQFITTGLTAEGRLLRSRHAGTTSGPAFLEDYAALVQGLLELHAVTGETQFLSDAAHYTQEMLRLFGDSPGGLRDVGCDDEQLPVRMMGGSDGVIPAANGLAAQDLLRLATLTGEGGYRERAEGIVRAFAGKMARQPAGYLTLIRVAEQLSS